MKPISFVKWHGGKSYLAKKIIELLPEHHTYVEPFGGGAAVLLNKPRSKVEHYNDLDERITRLFRVVRDHGPELQRRLALTPYSEIEFVAATKQSSDEIEQARRDYIRWRMSIGGRGKAFSRTIDRVRREMADSVSAYLSAIDKQLPLVIERLRTVEISCRPAIDVIKRLDAPDTLIYADPPYLPSTRQSNSRDLYAHEMSEDDHRELATVLNSCKSRVIVSGYPSSLYDELYGDWRVVEFDLPNNAAGGKAKARKKERLWLNWS
jgi:DNA adenine methylase